jgi:transcriptional regulator with XRE-family HTH domain
MTAKHWTAIVLKQMLEERRMNGASLAKLSKISSGQIYRYLNGESLPALHTIEKLFLALDHEFELMPLRKETKK